MNPSPPRSSGAEEERRWTIAVSRASGEMVGVANKLGGCTYLPGAGPKMEGYELVEVVPAPNPIEEQVQEGDAVEERRRFDVFLLSGEGMSRYRDLAASQVGQQLWEIGLEWKLSDWPHKQAVTITVLPTPDHG